MYCSNHYGIEIFWGWVVMIADICEGITPCMFVGLECVDYLAYCIIKLGYAVAFYVWMSPVESRCGHVFIS